MELFQLTWELLTRSFWPAAGILWLGGGAFASLPLILLVAWKFQDHFWNPWVKAAIWIVVAAALWTYIHLWTASMYWFGQNVYGWDLSASEGWQVAFILLFVWLVEFVIWVRDSDK